MLPSTGQCALVEVQARPGEGFALLEHLDIVLEARDQAVVVRACPRRPAFRARLGRRNSLQGRRGLCTRQACLADRGDVLPGRSLLPERQASNSEVTAEPVDAMPVDSKSCANVLVIERQVRLAEQHEDLLLATQSVASLAEGCVVGPVHQRNRATRASSRRGGLT